MAVAVVVTGLTGCTAASPEPPVVTTAAPSPSASAAPVSVFDEERLTTGTGTLTGAVRGSVAITSASQHGFRIEITTTAVDGARDRDVTLATALGDTDCDTANDSDQPRSISWGVQPIEPATSIKGPNLTNAQGDISYLKVLVLADEDHRCDLSTAGIARLKWTRDPELRALTATDSGAAPHADGDVTSRAGTPVSYVVAPGDDLSSVSKRFALAPDEILYLNPRRTRGADTSLYYDEVLNLDSAHR